MRINNMTLKYDVSRGKWLVYAPKRSYSILEILEEFNEKHEAIEWMEQTRDFVRR